MEYFKSIELTRKLFLFYALVFQLALDFSFFFSRGACGILVPWPGIKPVSPALEGKVLTTGPQGKYH